MISYEIIVKELAQELNIPERIVREVVRHQFKATKDIIEDGDLKGVLLRYLGKFAVKPGRLEKYVKETKKLRGDQPE